MFCDKCGTQIPDGSTFCPNCGNVVTNAQPAQPAPANTGFVNAAGQYGQGQPGAAPYTPGQPGAAPYTPGQPGMPYAQAPMPKPKKKSSAPIIIGVVAAVAVIAVAAMLLGGGKAYMKPIDKLFKAYNNNDLSLLQEALADDLYTYWNTDSVLDPTNDVSYTVLSTVHAKDQASYYGGTDLYRVKIDEKIYSSYFGDYYNAEETVIVCKLNGKWKIVDFE